MDAEVRENASSLIEELAVSAPEYSFFQAVYLAEALTRDLHPDRKDFGYDQRGLRFRPYENYSYPPTDIRSCTRNGNALEFVLNFMGFYGINSPLPRCFHEQIVLHQQNHGAGNVPLQNFLDIFNNRFYWLYYLAWKKYRYYLQLGEKSRGPDVDRVFAFAGKGIGQSADDGDTDPFFLLQFSGILSSRARGKTGLRILIEESFPGVKATIREFVPRRVTFADIPLLGRRRAESASRLGVTSIMGRSAVVRGNRICVELGPMPSRDYLSLLPGRAGAAQLRKLLGWYLHDNLEYDVKLLVDSATIVPLRLGDRRCRLGLASWLRLPGSPYVAAYYTFERYSRSN